MNILRTIESLLEQTYREKEIIIVDDGSQDHTAEKVRSQYENHPNVRLYTKENGGKSSALNYGIERAQGEIIICIDGDTILERRAVNHLVQYLQEENVGAVAGNVKVGNKTNILTRWQNIEYITAQNLDRRAFDMVNAITVIPGAIGGFWKEVVQKAGGFTHDTIAEDCDLTLRILAAGYRVRSCSRAIAITEAPEKITELMKQRFRWSYGIMQSFWKHKEKLFQRKYGSLGMIALPNLLFFQILLPILAPIADIMLLISIAWNWNHPNNIIPTLVYYLVFTVIDILISLMAFLFEKENLRELIWILPQRFFYRQFMYIVLFRSIQKAIRGDGKGWDTLQRTGNIQNTTHN